MTTIADARRQSSAYKTQGLTAVVPLTTKLFKKRSLATHVFVLAFTSISLEQHSIALCEKVTSINYEKVIGNLGHVDDSTLEQITEAVKVQIGVYERFVDLLKEKLKSRLVGVYLHGSLAMGSYFQPKSDMDFIIVINNSLDADHTKALNLSIARYAETRPTIGSIECSMITLQTAKNMPEQVPYELHYSEFWHKRILDGTILYDAEQFDSDLPAHLMCIKKRGICLYGMAIDEVFGDVCWQSFLSSVMDDFNWIVENENICKSPYYGVLNICRVLQIISEKNEKYLSKYEGAAWGIEHLPNRYVPLVQKALEVYASDTLVTKNERKTGGVSWNKAALVAFRDYARGRSETI